VTTICYKDGIMAADSCVSIETEAGGARKFRCVKLYRKGSKKDEAVIALFGESSPGMVFLDWYGSGKPAPTEMFGHMSSDFGALILTRKGLFEADAYCRLDRVEEKFYAVGSGAKAALGAMHSGASARLACSIACKIDPYSAPPIAWMSLSDPARVRKKKV
jgi:hypothetical protein